MEAILNLAKSFIQNKPDQDLNLKLAA
jgi:hypothetical protein